MFKRLAATLWGNFKSREELKKFLMLGFVFFLIIGTYWILRPIKDSVFGAMVPYDYQPLAKFLSLLIITPLLMIYSKLLDVFERHKVFYILAGIYGSLALIFAWFFLSPEYGISAVKEDPRNILGWAWYVYVESFGSLIVALFWAITVDITPPDQAKRGFPLIALMGQLGNILGPLFVVVLSKQFDNSGPVVAISGGLMFATAFFMWLFMYVIPARDRVGYKEEEAGASKDKPGFFDGLRLLLTKGYLFGIFFAITAYEVIITIFDFYFKSSVKDMYPLEADRAYYLGTYGVYTGIVATLCVLGGINNIQRKLGMRASLLLMPIMVASAVVLLWVSPSLSMAFWIMVIAKAVNYALNQPTIKQLYIPTSSDTKYKATAWIETFGSRGSKAGGSAINLFKKVFTTKYGAIPGATIFLSMSSVMSLGIIAVWFFVAMFVARTYDKAIKEDKIVC